MSSLGWPRLVRNTLLFTFFLIVLVLSVVPLAVRHGVVYWLEQQQLAARFHYLEISPLRGYVTLHGLQGQNSAGRGFAVDELHLAWKWLPLLERRVELTEIRVAGVKVDVAAVPDHSAVRWELGGLLPPASSEAAAPTAEPAAPAQRWAVSLPEIQLTDVALCLFDATALAGGTEAAPPLCASWASLALAGPEHQLSLPGMLLALPDNVTLNKFLLADPATHENWLSLAAVELQGWRWQDNRFAMQGLNIDKLTVLPLPQETRSTLSALGGSAKADQLSWDQLRIEQAEFAPANIVIEQINLAGLQAYVVHNSEGQLLLQQTLDRLVQPWQALFVAAASEQSDSLVSSELDRETPAEVSNTGSQLRINQIQMTGAGVDWLDQQLANTVHEQVKHLSLTLGPINSLEPAQATPLDVRATLGAHGTLSGQATLKPFSEKLNATGEISVNALDLLPLSPYSEQVISYKIRQGQLNNTVKFSVIDDEIDAQAKLRLQKFYLDPLPDAEKTGSEADTGMPIGTALNLLRDGDNNIPLELPIAGTVGDPSVSPSYIIGVVGRKALTQAVLHYYGPFGLVTIAKATFDAATKLRFESLYFAPTSSELSAAAKKQLAKQVELLQQRAQLSLVFCASANYSDWQPETKLERVETLPELSAEERKTLLNLAKQRNNAVKQWLLEQEVDAQQVVTCNPALKLRSLGPVEMTVTL